MFEKWLSLHSKNKEMAKQLNALFKKLKTTQE